MRRLLLISLLFILGGGSLQALPLLAGHVRVGVGVENWPKNSAGFEDKATLGQLSLDFKPFLYPVYYSFDFTGTIKEKGQYSVPGTLGELETQTQTFSFGPRYYYDIGLINVYGGASLTYLKAQQRLEGNAVLKEVSENGLGATFTLGLTDLQIFLPKVGWGVEYRVAYVDIDTLVDVEPRKGTWLLTTGFKF